MRITASVGTASAAIGELDTAELGATIERLVVAADEAMYRAKRAGGNRFRHSA